MSELTVVSGPPGAGKSTVARLLADSFPRSAVVVGDQFFTFIAGGWIEPWRPEAERQNEIVTAAAAAAAGQLAAGGYVVVYDGVVGPWLLPTFLAHTGLERLDYAVLLPPEDVCIDRVRTRAGHGFTDLGATRHMYRDFAAAQLTSRHLLTSATDSPEQTVAEIRRRRAAGLLVAPAT